MKILITGSLGLTGSAAVELFKEKGWDVVGIDNNMRSRFFGVKETDDDETIKIDIRDEGAINELFKQHKFDAIVHAAAQPSHDYSKDHPMLDFYVNVVGTMNLLEATRKYCPKATFVYVSTDKVYGENMSTGLRFMGMDGLEGNCLIEHETRFEPQKPVTINGVKMHGEGTASYSNGFGENLGLDFAGKRTPFGTGKAAADLYVQEYGYQYGIKTACFRPGCITGSKHKGAEQHGFLAYLAKCIKEGKIYKIYGYKGKQVRDQIHSMDLASAFFAFISNPGIARVYNIGGGPDRSVSIQEAGALISQETGKEFIHEYIDEPRHGDRIWDVHDVSKFRKDYPEWQYQYSLSDIIEDVCQTTE